MERTAISLLGVLFVVAFSYSTSPLYPAYFGNDSAQFLTYGKLWAQGSIPYLDMFDHKGPLIFFVNMLGFKLFHCKEGVGIIQMLFMVFTVNGIYSISREKKRSFSFGLGTVLVSLIIMKLNYGDGNLTEEYCLPFLVWSMYFQLRYLRKNEQPHNDSGHPVSSAGFYGLAFGVCFLTRITNAITICAGVLIIILLLASRKKWKNLFHNALGFVAGFLLAVLPFVLYFSRYSAVDDMLFASFVHNYTYTMRTPSWLGNMCQETLLRYLRLYFPILLIWATGIICLTNKHKALGWFCFIAGALELGLSLKAPLYIQYALAYAPQVALLLSELFEQPERIDREGLLRFLIIGVMILHMGYVAEHSIATAADVILGQFEKKNTEWQTLVQHIPEEDRSNVIAWGHDNLKSFYLETDITPCYKHMFIQDWYAYHNDDTAADIIKTFQQGNAKWILTDDTTARIDNILQQRYQLTEQTGIYQLYHLADPAETE